MSWGPQKIVVFHKSNMFPLEFRECTNHYGCHVQKLPTFTDSFLCFRRRQRLPFYIRAGPARAQPAATASPGPQAAEAVEGARPEAQAAEAAAQPAVPTARPEAQAAEAEEAEEDEERSSAEEDEEDEEAEGAPNSVMQAAGSTMQAQAGAAAAEEPPTPAPGSDLRTEEDTLRGSCACALR